MRIQRRQRLKAKMRKAADSWAVILNGPDVKELTSMRDAYEPKTKT